MPSHEIFVWRTEGGNKGTYLDFCNQISCELISTDILKIRKRLRSKKIKMIFNKPDHVPALPWQLHLERESGKRIQSKNTNNASARLQDVTKN